MKKSYIVAYIDVERIVMQQHYNGENFFNRTWDEFKIGFGDLGGNFWLGNERLHLLTKDARCRLRVDLQAKNDSNWYWTEYSMFIIDSEARNYMLHIGGYNGTAGDSLARVNVHQFTTKDRDNDYYSSANCAVAREGGFWYDACANAQPNSPYTAWKGFCWDNLPVGSTQEDKMLISSRMTLMFT